MRWLVGLAGLLAIGAAAAPAPKPIAPRAFVRWSGGDATRSWASNGVTVTLARSGNGNGMTPLLTVRVPGKSPLTVTINGGDNESNTYVAIGQLARGQSSSVVVQSWTGGAHCCFHLIVVQQQGSGLRAIDFGRWDGDQIAWPRDRDRDGNADFVFVDNAFLYTFGCYACSWAPPQIMTIRAGKAADISAEPAFRPLFVADMAKARKACLPVDIDDARGACAGYLADAARLGQFERAKGEVSRKFAKGELDFAASVAAFLRKQGYLK